MKPWARRLAVFAGASLLTAGCFMVFTYVMVCEFTKVVE